MQKLSFLLIIGFYSLSANSGEDIDKAKHTISHKSTMLMDKTNIKTPHTSDEAKKFKMRSMQMQTEMKCGAAKCGSTTTSSKCGAVKIPTH